jgi:hypothetical protein
MVRGVFIPGGVTVVTGIIKLRIRKKDPFTDPRAKK